MSAERMPADTGALVLEIIASHRGLDGPALPILHAVQDALGYVPETAIPIIAEALNITRAEMHGVVTFYHDFRRQPAGRHILKLCRAEACQAAGGHVVEHRVRERLGIGFGETTADGQVTLEAVYCLGLCATAPSAVLDGRLLGRLDADGADAMLSETRR